MKKKVEYLFALCASDMQDIINDFLKKEGPRWRLVNVHLDGSSYIAWLEFEG